MSGANPHQQHVNQPDFPKRLDDDNSAVWQIVLDYVSDEVRRRLWRRSVEGDREDLAERYSSDVCETSSSRLAALSLSGVRFNEANPPASVQSGALTVRALTISVSRACAR